MTTQTLPTMDAPAAAGHRGPHPGLLMLLFFMVLIGFNVAFFAIAANAPHDVIARDDPRVRVVPQRHLVEEPAPTAEAPGVTVEPAR